MLSFQRGSLALIYDSFVALFIFILSIFAQFIQSSVTHAIPAKRKRPLDANENRTKQSRRGDGSSPINSRAGVIENFQGSARALIMQLTPTTRTFTTYAIAAFRLNIIIKHGFPTASTSRDWVKDSLTGALEHIDAHERVKQKMRKRLDSDAYIERIFKAVCCFLYMLHCF